MHRVTQRLGVLVPVIVEVRRLVHRDGSYATHPLDADLAGISAVFDPGTRIVVRSTRGSPLEAVQDGGDRTVPLRVDRDPPARRPRPLDQLDEISGFVEEGGVLPSDVELLG